MSNVIAFIPKRRSASRPPLPAGEAGEILLFCGVRYERAPQSIDLSARLDETGRNGTR
jgi:hypothetical protein